MVGLTVITQVRFEEQSDEDDNDRESDEARREHCQRKMIDQAGREIFDDRHAARREPEERGDARQMTKKGQGPVVTKEHDEQTKNAQAITYRFEFRRGSFRAASEWHRNLSLREPFIDGLDCQLDFQFKAAGRTGTCL